jgi:hypothetical protein
MKRSYLMVIFVTLIMIAMISANTLIAAGPTNPSRGHAKVVIPPHAAEIAPGIFHLGIALDKGRVVEGYAIITPHKKKFAKPGCNNDGICDPDEKKNCADCKNSGDVEPDPDTSSCFEYTRGAKWKRVEPYIVNPSNDAGLDHNFIKSNLESDIGEWEFAADRGIIGGQSSTGDTLEADTIQPDGYNEVYFADVEYANAIGVTIVWGIFRGPPHGRELVEWDQVYDDVDFDWSEDCSTPDDCPGKMDFWNIAMHELGHTVGAGDLYENLCSEQTMYGYAGYGEINKRTLENGDITGIWELYNN